MNEMFKKIKEACRRYNNGIIRNAFERAIEKGEYNYALHLAEVNYMRIDLSKEDLDRLKIGFNEYHTRLINLENRTLESESLGTKINGVRR